MRLYSSVIFHFNFNVIDLWYSTDENAREHKEESEGGVECTMFMSSKHCKNSSIPLFCISLTKFENFDDFAYKILSTTIIILSAIHLITFISRFARRTNAQSILIESFNTLLLANSGIHLILHHLLMTEFYVSTHLETLLMILYIKLDCIMSVIATKIHCTNS